MQPPGRKTGIVVVIALAHVVAHVATNSNYGIFRDELYYLACSDRLDWGYVDHPPLSIAVLALVRALLGDSVDAIRLPAALAGGAAVLLTARLARNFGGGPGAQWTAALGYAATATSLVLFGFFSMNAFDVLFWLMAALIAVRLIAGGDRRLWLLLGFTVGLGLLNKYSMGFFALALAIALVLTPQRTVLGGPWPWAGAALAVLLFAPHVVWQVYSGFPTLEFVRNAQAQKIATMSPLAYVAAQVVQTNPLLSPLWLMGLGYLLFGAPLRRYRAFGLAYLILLTGFVLQQAKPYYLAPIYPVLFAAGGVALERIAGRARIAHLLVALWLIASGAVIAPLALPILPPGAVGRYTAALGIEVPREERAHTGALPQHFADRFGWENMAATVAHVYQSLPAHERALAAIVTGNYGQAGAVDYFGRRLGLPRAISGHNNYWLWGYGSADGRVVISIGLPHERLLEVCGSLQHAATIVSPYAMPHETNLPVYVCRDLKLPMDEAWRSLKKYI